MARWMYHESFRRQEEGIAYSPIYRTWSVQMSYIPQRIVRAMLLVCVVCSFDGFLALEKCLMAFWFGHDMQETSSSATTSSSKVAEGTYRYMSPERLRDSNSDSPAADIYAFAMVMTKCIIGRLAMRSNGEKSQLCRGGLDGQWVYRIAKGDRPELPSGIPDLGTYKTSIEKCWESDPAKRPSSEVVAAEHLKRLKELRTLDSVSCELEPSWSTANRQQEAELHSSTNETPPLAGSAGSAPDSCPTHPSSPSQQSFTEPGADGANAVVAFDATHDDIETSQNRKVCAPQTLKMMEVHPGSARRPRDSRLCSPPSVGTGTNLADVMT
eukprot:5728242-Amphidinium_carterae.1